MTARTQQTNPRRWLPFFLAALLAALAAILVGTTASASAAVGAETRVGAFNVAGEVLVEPPQHETAGQHPGRAEDSAETVVATGVAANSADEFVDLASATRRNHILNGDATGGGHLWPGLPGKTPFPRDWSADRVMHEISDVATDPTSIFRTGRGGSTIVTGTRDGVDIRVILRDGDIITGYPTNLVRNP